MQKTFFFKVMQQQIKRKLCSNTILLFSQLPC